MIYLTGCCYNIVLYQYNILVLYILYTIGFHKHLTNNSQQDLDSNTNNNINTTNNNSNTANNSNTNVVYYHKLCICSGVSAKLICNHPHVLGIRDQYSVNHLTNRFVLICYNIL